jgi:hypothetical protein
MERFCRQLGEHVDSIQVIATSSEQGESDFFAYGIGNHYARIGSCQEFLDTERSGVQARVFIREGVGLTRGRHQPPLES